MTYNIDIGKGDNYTFFVSTSLRLHAHFSKSVEIVDCGFTHLIAKDACLFSSLNKTTKEEIFVVDGYSLTIIGCGRIECQNGVITSVYHVPSLSVNLMFIAQ